MREAIAAAGLLDEPAAWCTCDRGWCGAEPRDSWWPTPPALIQRAHHRTRPRVASPAHQVQDDPDTRDIRETT